MSLNEYGSILDALQDDVGDDISRMSSKLKDIDKQIKKLQTEKKRVQSSIKDMEYMKKRYLEMIDLIGKA